jgi:hypothetical protein
MYLEKADWVVSNDREVLKLVECICFQVSGKAIVCPLFI